jgi:hypothetical protein
MEDKNYEVEAYEGKIENKPRPWRRFWARQFDLTVHMVILVLIWSMIHDESLDSIPDNAFMVLFTFIWIFMEGLYMSYLGNTPGKKILNIQVIAKDGSKLPKSILFKRARLVWYRGMGLGLGIIQLIANIVGYKNLKKNGITTWDNELGSKVVHYDIGIIRLLVCPVVVMMIVLLSLVSLVV